MPKPGRRPGRSGRPPRGRGRRCDLHAESKTIEILLYTRRGCHLCEAVEDLLPHHAHAARVVDIGGDDRLEAEYGLRVPVLVIDGAVAAEGRIDESTLIVALARRGVTGRD